MRLEKAMNSEIKRRVEANRTLQRVAEQMANEMLERLQTRIAKQIEKLTVRLITKRSDRTLECYADILWNSALLTGQSFFFSLALKQRNGSGVGLVNAELLYESVTPRSKERVGASFSPDRLLLLIFRSLWTSLLPDVKALSEVSLR